MNWENSKSRVSTASRRTFLTGSGGALMAGLAGCLGGGSSENTINILASAASSAEQEVWDGLTEDFESDSEYTVEWEYVGFGEHNNRLSSMIRGGNAPDLTSWNSASGGNAYVEGIAAPLTDVVEDIAQETGSEIQDNFLMRQDGEIWFLPNAMYLHDQNIRGDLVSEVGHEFQPQDITFDEHLSWVQDINAETDTGGWAGSTAANNAGAQTTNAYLYQNGVEIYQGTTDDIEVVIDQGENEQRTVEVLEHLASASDTGPSGASWAWGELSDSFISASASSINYPYGRILQQSMDRDASWAPDHVNWAEPPHGGRSADERRGLAALFGWTLVEGGENTEAAKDFLKFFFTSDYFIDFLHTVPLHYSPVMDHIWDDSEYLDNELIETKSNVLDLQKERASNAKVPALSLDGNFNPAAASSQQAGVLGQMVAEVIHNGTAPEQAVTDAAENLRDHT